jgi:hypothetical protein
MYYHTQQDKELDVCRFDALFVSDGGNEIVFDFFKRKVFVVQMSSFISAMNFIFASFGHFPQTFCLWHLGKASGKEVTLS